ncbi:MAG: MiaB/RimO family radical SAM methylthiotransferase [Candidatus Bipolaricaulota bacterium]
MLRNDTSSSCSPETPRHPRVALVTFGCRVNQADTDAMRRSLASRFLVTEETPDVVVINGCAVTRLAEKKARQAARRAHATGASVILVGCLADAAARGWTTFAPAELLAGNAWKPHVQDVVAAILCGRRGALPARPILSLDDERTFGIPGRVRAFLKIEDGCSRACAYCLAVKVRGPVRSKSLAAAEAEARDLVARGVPEIVLAGINLAEYAPEEGSLPDLVRRLLAIPGLARLRLASIPADGLTDALLHVAAGEPRFARHFHVPAQSGDDRTLRAMRRATSVAQHLDAISRARKILPDATFGTDLLVGFPGEDEAAFARTCDLVRTARYANLHAFRYSERPGTEAAGFRNSLAEDVKRARAEALHRVWEPIRRALLDERIGATEDVLVEERCGRQYRGYTSTYLPVRFRSPVDLPVGSMARVRIVRAAYDEMEGVSDHRSSADRADAA